MDRGSEDSPPAGRVADSQAGFEFVWDPIARPLRHPDAPEADIGQSHQRNGSRFFAVIESLTGEPLLRSMDLAVHFNTLTPFLT